MQQLSQNTEKIYPSREALEQELTKRKIVIYYGIDPTSPQIHLGHLVVLRKLRQFQEFGHKVILLFGDFTALVGDPSGRDKQRQPLTEQEISENVSSYKRQLEKVFDFKNNPPKILYNSSWWDKINSRKFLRLLLRFTTSQLLERDMFQERIKKRLPISIGELIYPILQAYDCVEMDVDAEIGGSDQTFNMLLGRDLIRSMKNKEKFVITMPILAGTDGRKMSKTFNNTISIDDQPTDIYGKLMSIKDDLISEYARLLTSLDSQTLRKLEAENPMIAKKALAYDIVKNLYGEHLAKEAQDEFERVFQKRQTPKAAEFFINETLLNQEIKVVDLLVLSGLTNSKNEARRLIEQNAVSIDNKRVKQPDEKIKVKAGLVVTAGKRKAATIATKGG